MAFRILKSNSADAATRNCYRYGVASIEVVLATATSFVTAVFLAGAGIRACRNLYHTIANLVGWPFM